MRTLVLDQGYQPINCVPFSRAMRYICKGKVEVLEEYSEYPVHPDWQAPAVVRLTHWIRPHKAKVKFSRQNVLARDRYRCQYCGDRKPVKELTFDHVVPRSRGGKTTWENIVTCCSADNLEKADRTPREAGMKLRKPPVRPPWLPIFNMALRGVVEIPVEWREYWHAELMP